jgi:hypothetical protein
LQGSYTAYTKRLFVCFLPRLGREHAHDLFFAFHKTRKEN